MDIIDKIGRSLGIGDYDEKDTETAEPEKPKTTPKMEVVEKPEVEYAPKNVFDFNSASAFKRENSASTIEKIPASEIKTIKPKTLNDARIISDLLREKIAVVVNLEETESPENQRIVDFICGTTYAIDGAMKHISNKVFICAPKNVTVESYEDEKKSKGNFFD